MQSVSALALVFFLALASGVDCGEDDADVKRMEGTWSPASAELAGVKLPEEAVKAMKLILKGNEYTVLIGEKKDQGTVKLDTSKMPRAMDVTGTQGPNQGKTYRAIYEITKDGLKICYDLSGKDRPAEFATRANTELFLVTYTREK
jgi:uncharacterized protein (TIGR03067 family)